MNVLKVQDTNNDVGKAGAVSRVIQPEEAPDAETILLGFAPGKSYFATGIARHGNFLQWGWSAPPSKMTTAGQNLFINSLCYIQKFDGKAPIITPNRTISVRREPVNVVGSTRLLDTVRPGFKALDLSSVFNRPHYSMKVGGGDDASFKTWFKDHQVKVENIPFIVNDNGNDVLVSPNNTENVFEIKGINRSARGLHFLIWGYMRPRPDSVARLSIQFTDKTSQDFELPLNEWTQATGPVAFDFTNTVRFFKHAAITHHTVQIEHPEKSISAISSQSGIYGLVAITLEEENLRNTKEY